MKSYTHNEIFRVSKWFLLKVLANLESRLIVSKVSNVAIRHDEWRGASFHVFWNVASFLIDTWHFRFKHLDGP